VFKGEVVLVATKGVNTSNVVTFEVKVEVKGPNRKLLKPEMTANVAITAVERDGVVLVPVAAVSRQRRERVVTVQKAGGLTEPRPIKVGASDGESMEVTEGLTEGETVVLQKAGQDRWQRQGGADKKGNQAQMQMRMLGGGGPGGGGRPH
jgi:multidrug efflux pump subunit AcrA (membrane-fusion protein)